MLGRDSNQMSFFDSSWVEHLIPKDSLYYQLAEWGDRLVTDEEFAPLYSHTGRRSHSPARLTKALILMYFEGCSDRDAQAKTQFDLRWKWALGLELDDTGIEHTIFSRFRLRLQLHNREKFMFDRLLELAIEAGVLDTEAVQAIDSTIIHGAGAVQDTYTLIKKAIAKVLSVAKSKPRLRKKMLKSLIRDDYEMNGKPDINWENLTDQNILLSDLIKDAYTLIEHVSNENEPIDEKMSEAVLLLSQVTDQDVEVADGKVQIRNGVAKDRIVSVTDPEMRHGHKSRHNKVDGYKVNIMEDLETELITSTEVTPANATDTEPVEKMLTEQSSLGIKPDKIVGDTAYGSGKFRKKIDEAGSEIVSKVAKRSNKGQLFSKDRFKIHCDQDQVRCPAGKLAKDYTVTKDNEGKQVKIFRFPAIKCNTCMLKDKCTKSDKGRTIRVTAYEKRIQEAKLQQQTFEFKQLYCQRAKVERKIAHIMRQCNRRARYIGREKVNFQMKWTAVAQNLSRIGKLLAGSKKDLREAWEQALNNRMVVQSQ